MFITAIRLSGCHSRCLRSLRVFLWIQGIVGIGGFLCAAFGTPMAYYYEWCSGQFIGAGAQGILLHGIWRSVYPRIGGRGVRMMICVAVAILGVLLALNFRGQIGAQPFSFGIVAEYAIGCAFSILTVCLVLLSFLKDSVWPPAAVRCLIGFSLSIASSFGIETTESLVGWNYWVLAYAPAIIFLFVLVIWNSAVSLDRSDPIRAVVAA